MLKRRKSAANRKESPIRVLVTKEQKKLLQARADAAGLALSSWIRLTVLKSAGVR